ncbi:helix-turn-helix transcriptional regulator, partial [Streptomyces sp. T-3]|nr:helix-turn-helix transcriptional regulator [Streptomyces sp. T-3]
GSRAGTLARRAWQLAADCGAQKLCEQILPGHSEPVREPVRGPSGMADQLSDGERRVASLAAFGHTNREIAATLYITVSTVEHHLTRIYRKLNISRRHELPLDLRHEATAPVPGRPAPEGAWPHGTG